MSKLIKIASWTGQSRANVIFVHGLGGHAYKTWRRGEDDNTFWPIWLAEDVEGIKVYCLAYEAPVSNWLGTSMPLQDRAVNILELLLTEENLRSGPVVFVCHSLGGLIVKKIVLDLQQQAMRRPEAANLLDRIKAVVFAATPHTGSSRATWLDRLSFLAWPSSVARILVANDPGLRDINVTYRGFADDRRQSLRHQIFYETRGTAAGVIVDEASADPGLPGDPPIPIDADHVSIVKPEERASLLYARVKQFIERIPVAAGEKGQLDPCELPAVRSEQPLNLVPKLIRVAVLCLVVVIGFKGVQALISPKVDVGAIQQPLVDQLAVKDKQIADLTAALIDRRTTPAPPGADQQLKKAVIAIDEGAKTDTRYAQALELLKAGKPSEAEPLLKAVAEDKQENAADANREAAAAFRNLASIAAVSDPGRARDYYAKAAKLDPNHVEGLYLNGSYQLEAGDLVGAQTAFERVLDLAEPPDARSVFWARNGLGDILISRGDLTGALKIYRDGFATMDGLAKSDPGNAGWQRDLSASFERIGDVRVAQGDLAEALKSYRDGLVIRERLAASDSGNAEWQSDLAVSINKVGDVQVAQGDLAGALKSYRDGLTIVERLAKSDPGNAGWQRDLSVSFNRIGNVQVAQGDLAVALKSYRDLLAIADRLAKSDPGNASWQRDLTVSFNKVGEVQVAQGDLAGAQKSYHDSLAIRDRLVKSDPGNAGWQLDLSESFNRVGDVQVAQGDVAAARESYGDSVAIRDRLVKSDPGNAGWQHDLAMSLLGLGTALGKQGDKDGAIGVLKQGRDIVVKLVKLSPDNAVWRRDLETVNRQIERVTP
jgi:tetratricopeptide (TPR) repeat protein